MLKLVYAISTFKYCDVAPPPSLEITPLKGCGALEHENAFFSFFSWQIKCSLCNGANIRWSKVKMLAPKRIIMI